jgi:hypothetical protein
MATSGSSRPLSLVGVAILALLLGIFHVGAAMANFFSTIESVVIFATSVAYLVLGMALLPTAWGVFFGMRKARFGGAICFGSLAIIHFALALMGYISAARLFAAPVALACAMILIFSHNAFGDDSLTRGSERAHHPGN